MGRHVQPRVANVALLLPAPRTRLSLAAEGKPDEAVALSRSMLKAVALLKRGGGTWLDFVGTWTADA